ncbi:hypothetical protein NG798_12245 [Ancylothrix sp. C2]|nr:hypothetical protein [Ancylothrix sp. D3o]
MKPIANHVSLTFLGKFKKANRLGNGRNLPYLIAVFGYSYIPGNFFKFCPKNAPI